MSLLLFVFSLMTFFCSLRVLDHIEAAILYGVMSILLAFISYLANKHTELCKTMENQSNKLTDGLLQEFKNNLSSHEKPTLK